MTVTIAIPYSADTAPFIERCVRSALAQTYKNTRVVVVGDGATPPLDFTDPRLVVHTLGRNHGGAPFAQQVALLATPDEWYAPLGADDWLEPDHVTKLLEIGESAVATGTVFWYEQWRADRKPRPTGVRKVWYETGVFQSERLRAFGGYDASEQSGQDNCVLWLLEVYGGLQVRTGIPTYHRRKRHYGSVSVKTFGTAERRASDARTITLVKAARAGLSITELKERRTTKGPLARELDAEVSALREKIQGMKAINTGIDVLIVSNTWDPAGIGVTYAKASTPDLRIRSAHRQQTYLDYPCDIVWDASTDALVRQLASRADLVHLQMKPELATSLGLDRLNKPIVLEHHGSAFRKAVALLTAQARHYRMVVTVSTVDLLRYGEDLIWLPAPLDIERMMELREQHLRKPDGRIRVVQTPTSRIVKSTAKLNEAVKSLQAEGVPIDLVLGEKIPWREALALKATADVFFDQVQLGYGSSAIEAWGMGLPVIAGGDAWTEARMRVEFDADELPFYKATDTVESIRDALRALMSEDLRAEYGSRGATHVRKFHGKEAALARLADVYAMALNPVPQPAQPAARVSVFRSMLYPALSLTLDGHRFKFAGGRLRVSNSALADLVRLHALASPKSGIIEVLE